MEVNPLPTRKKPPAEQVPEESTLVSAAKAIGAVAGKIASLAGATPETAAATPEARPARKSMKPGKLQAKHKSRLPRRQKKAQKKALAKVQ